MRGKRWSLLSLLKISRRAGNEIVRITQTKQFKKDFRKQLKRGKKPEKLFDFLEILVKEREIPQKYKDHALRGNWVGRRDCHIEPDWVLIYQKREKEIVLERTGSHSDLF